MLNKLKKKLHILQNIYIKNNYFFKRKSYAMDGEDTALLDYCENIKQGFYVDVGAHHPIQRSNTHLLYLKGWRGVNIDVSDFSLELFNFLRPDDLNIQSAISDKDGEIELYYQKDFSQLSTTDIRWAKENFNNSFKTKKINSITLNTLLKNSIYKNKNIDFLNVDVEGAELEVLTGLDFNIYKPKVLCIEILGHRHLDSINREESLQQDKIYEYLKNKNYKKVWSGSSFCSHLFLKNN